MDLSLFRESLDKQTNGVPIYIGDSTFICRRYGTEESNKKIKEIQSFLFGPFHKRADGDENLVFAHWLVEYGIVGWENVTDGKEVIKFNEENCRKIFLNKEVFMSLNRIIFNDVNNFENYLHDEVEEEIEELKKP